MSDLSNEFDQSEQLSDLEFLKAFKPEWTNERIEPLTPLPDNITPPTWNKVELVDNQPTSAAAAANDLELVPVIAGKEDGSTFTPGIVNAIGPFTAL